MFDASLPDHRSTPHCEERSLRGLELVMAHSGAADLVIGDVVGELRIEHVRQAAHWLQARHPGLRAYVERCDRQRPNLRYCRPEHATCFVEEITASAHTGGTPVWQQVAAREAHHHFELTRPDGLRVILVRSGREQHLVVNASHAVVDGVSLLRLLHELLSAICQAAHGQLLQPVPLPPTPAVLTQLPPKLHERASAWLGRPLAVLEQRRFIKRSLFRPSDSVVDLKRLGAHCLFHAGDADAWSASRLQQKRYGVTVGGIYSAAVAVGALRHLQRNGGGWAERQSYRLPLAMDFSLRAQIPGASVTQESIGLFTGIAQVGGYIDPSWTIWDVATAIKRRSQAQSERRMPLLYHTVLDRFYEVNCEPRAYGIDYLRSGGAGDGINISNVGKYPYANTYDGLQLRSIYGLNGPIAGGPMFIFWLRSVAGHFCYNASALASCFDAQAARAFFHDVVALMEASGSAALDATSVRTLVRGAHRGITTTDGGAAPNRAARESCSLI